MWILRLEPFLPGDGAIPPLTFRLFSSTDPAYVPDEITSEPINFAVTSVLEGVDDFTPAQLPDPPEPLEAEAQPLPAWIWFVAGALTIGALALGAIVMRRPENEATLRRRHLQSIRAQLALIDANDPSLDHLREARRLLIELESLTPLVSLPHALRDDLRAWHERYERDSFAPAPSSDILASLVADSQSIADRLHENAAMRREAS
ncbi:MAG: hypothetical protein ACF8GE_02320 [Phycisphaerales bacterium JB043]